MSRSNGISNRNDLAHAKASLQNAGINPETARLTPSFLRFEAPLVAGKTVYRFDVTQLDNFNGRVAYPTEKRLGQQDSFFASRMGLFLGVAAQGDADGQFQLLTYPSVATFPGAAEAIANTVYNGQLKLTVNQTEICPGLDLFRHRYVPTTQAGGALENEMDGSSHGFAPLEPNFVFIGNKTHQLTIELPAGLSSVISNSRIVLLYRGFLAQGSTPVAGV